MLSKILRNLIMMIPPFNQAANGVGMAEFVEPIDLDDRGFWTVLKHACYLYSPPQLNKHYSTFGDCWWVATLAYQYYLENSND